MAIVLLLLLSAGVRFYELSSLMPLIADQGWFYMSALTAVETDTVPLVGITASRTWLHQGPLYTYMLMVIFKLWGYNPIVPGYLFGILGVMCTYAVYVVGRNMFSSKVGLIAALMYATSPLVVLSDRMPYHTSLTPFLTVLLYGLVFKILRGETRLIPVMVWLGIIMYMTNIASLLAVVVSGLLVLFVHGRSWRRVNVTAYVKTGIVALGLLSPLILYDSAHGWKQVVVFPLWFLARPFVAIVTTPFDSSLSTTLASLKHTLTQLFFIRSPLIALALYVVFMAGLCTACMSRCARNLSGAHVYTAIWAIGLVAGVLIQGTASAAYVYTWYPIFALGIAAAWDGMGKLRPVAVVVLIVVAYVNIVTLVQHSFYVDMPHGYGVSLKRRQAYATALLQHTNGEPFALNAIGPGSEFPSYAMPMAFVLCSQGQCPEGHVTHRTVHNLYHIYESDGVMSITYGEK